MIIQVVVGKAHTQEFCEKFGWCIEQTRFFLITGKPEGDLRAKGHTRAEDVADDGATMDTGRRSKTIELSCRFNQNLTVFHSGWKGAYERPE